MAPRAVRRGRVGEPVLLASSGHSPVSPDRRGEVIEVLDGTGQVTYVVRWRDGRLSFVSPTAVTFVREATAAATVHVIGSERNTTNIELVRRWAAEGFDVVLVSAEVARALLRPGDVAIGRLDVLPTLDGVEPGLLSLLWLERSGVHVLNRAAAMIAVHDKLRTARVLADAGIPHPRTTHVHSGQHALEARPPLVLKPRFGSWGHDVLLCRDQAELERHLDAVRGRPWFRRHGVLLQELVPPHGYDLRLIVAGGEVVAGSERVAAAGDWRTNVSLGGTLRPAVVPPSARGLACAAAAAVGADLVGVDLLPIDGERHVVLELNGAVDFDDRYSLDGHDVYDEIARALGLVPTSP